MNFSGGGISSFYQSNEKTRLLGLKEIEIAMADTRDLIGPFIGNSVFCQGILNLDCLFSVLIYTIIRRFEKNYEPYLVTDLGHDLREGEVHRKTIDKKAEKDIREIAEDIENLPTVPQLVIIEDTIAKHYLIIEGNKRLSAVALSGQAHNKKVPAMIGHTEQTWGEMLSHFGITPP